MKYELHVHTSENDKVVHMTAPEIVRAYKGAGYDGLVITNHYFEEMFNWYRDILAGRGHRGIIDHYLTGYRLAKQEGDAIGVRVLLGLELRFCRTINDYLIYGVDEQFLYDAPLLTALDLDSVLALLPPEAVVYQAHPFRNDMVVTDPKKLFGVEVYNGNTSAERNDMAALWAERFGLRQISGSDFHALAHLGRGGVVFQNEVATEVELARELRAERYTLIKDFARVGW